MGTSYNPKIVTDGLVLNLDPANVKSYPANQDPFVNNVSLMLSMDGANNSTTFTDSSQNALAVTAVADAKISTAQSKFGGSAAYFDGTGDYLTVANNAVNAFGLGDFTIECWVNFSALPGTAGQNMGIANTMTSTDSATFTHWWLGLLNSAGTLRLRLGRHGNGDVFAYVNWTPALNTWYHIAVTRSSSSVVSMFINGVSQSVTTSGSNWANNFSATGILSIGLVATALTFNGYIDDFRLTRAARYTASFTPPSAPFSLPGRLTDLTKNKYLTTLTSGPTYSSNAINLSGTSQYLAVNGGMPSGTSTAFTFECWVRVTDLASYRAITRTVGGLDIGVIQTTGAVGCDQTAVATICATPSGAVVAGVWTHIAVTRTTGNLYTIYINGVSRASGTNAFTVTTATTIGFSAFSASHYFKGDMSIIKNYNRDLSANEILQNYNATKGRFIL